MTDLWGGALLVAVSIIIIHRPLGVPFLLAGTQQPLTYRGGPTWIYGGSALRYERLPHAGGGGASQHDGQIHPNERIESLIWYYTQAAQ